MFGNIKEKFNKIFLPVSRNEDAARTEFILNVLLLTCIGLSFVVYTINEIKNLMHTAVPVSVSMIFFVLCFFIILYVLSRKGFHRVASYCLLITLFLVITFQVYHWGADLPSALLSYVLIIVMAGVIIDTRVAFIATILISGTLIYIAHFQEVGAIIFNSHWKSRFSLSDTIVFAVIFLIIATVSWLSNREIERSLKRARKSEAELKHERDSLELIVEEKTRALKDAQEERIGQLYRFAEFGRLSSGLFHDLINPLNAVSLNIEQIKKNEGGSLSEAKTTIERAIIATRKMEDLVLAVRKQLNREENESLFSPSDEIRQVIEVLNHKAMRENVKIEFQSKANITTFGDATKFHYAVLNLASNAIDASSNLASPSKSKSPLVTISLEHKDDSVVLRIIDQGCGIKAEHIQKIFEPFFTTKGTTKGIGIGLSMTKRIIEKDFGGTISVQSKEDRGSEFIATFPIKPAPTH